MPKRNYLGFKIGRQGSNVQDASPKGRNGLDNDGSATGEGANSTAPQINDLYSTVGETGIRVIANPDEATLDIVFVHGLTGNRDKTWTHESGVFWPGELAEDITSARIMTFGYDADVVKLWGMVSGNTLRDHGKNLAYDVSDQRRRCRDRPIIFIAHSLGGLVCEQALLICRDGEAHLATLEKVFHSTQGIIFMGTPHRGADLAHWGKTLAKLLTVIRHTNPAIVGVLEKKSEVLAAVQEQFQQTLLKYHGSINIYCFYEEKPVRGVDFIVSKESALLPQYPNQSIGANHMDMTKFSGRNDAGYQRVLHRVLDIIEVINSASNDASERATGDGRQGAQKALYENDRDHEKKNKCCQLLSTSEYERHKERNPYPVQGTCQWFLRHQNYSHWRDNATSSILWVSADPGCGKSVLSKFLVDGKKQAKATKTTCYFFFKDDNEEQKTATNALCALLHQLFVQKPELLGYAVGVHDQNGDSFVTKVDLLWNLLTAASADPRAGEIVCILDALDECRESELTYLLRKICAFYENCARSSNSNSTALKFLVTSRPLNHIENVFSDICQNLPTIRLAGEEDTDQIKREIDLVIDDQLSKIQKRWKLDQKTLSSLRDEISKVEHRTYLWLKLIFDLIGKDAQSITKQGRRRIFGTIPDSVDSAYTAILNQSTDKEQAKKLLQIVCTAIKPLSVKEMHIAISIEQEDRSLDDLEAPSEEHSKSLIRNLCGLFVSVIDGRVYLLHQTAKEFLIGEVDRPQPAPADNWTWKHSLSVKHSNFILAHICMWYLRLDGFVLEEEDEDEDDYKNFSKTVERRVSSYYFLEYSAKHWATHFREATIPMEQTSIEMALHICNPQTHPYKIWVPVYWHNLGYNSSIPNLTSLHLASYFGHEEVVATLLAMPEIDINKPDSAGWTPLYSAASRRHTAVISQLFAMPGIDINKADNKGWTPLYSAASRGHTAVVSQLLAMPEIDINKANINSWTPLYSAAFKGHTAIVNQLLSMPEIDINKADNKGWTPLYSAVSRGHTAVVSQLLAMSGTDINKANSASRTPLYSAVYRRHTAVVSQLLAMPEIDINKPDNTGWIPLHSAAVEGHTAVVSQLLAMPGIDINKADNAGRTPLDAARRYGHHEIAGQLLKHGATISKPDSS